MRLLGVHLRTELTLLARVPAYVIPTLLYPTMLFAFFGLQLAQAPQAAPYLFASYAAISLIGVVLFQFGVGIAMERLSPWQSFLRVVPVPGGVRIAGRVLTALLFAAGAIGLVALVAALFTPLRMQPTNALALAATLLAGAVPFALLGIAIGYWASPRAAVPVANLIYLPLSFAGGLWQRPENLPTYLAKISPWLPTRQYGELIWGAAAGVFPVHAALALSAYTLLFAGVAYWGYRAEIVENYT
ncbi:MAG: ABC transporter permease [Vulcanimicrobiaceae bacterium]